MTSQTTSRSTGGSESETVTGPLRAFQGSFMTAIHFLSGHCLWLYNVSSSPTDVEAYREVWVATPDVETTLYTDPGEALDVVSKYHEFDNYSEAEINWERHDDTVDVNMEAADGTTLYATVELSSTLPTRLINGISAIVPDTLRESALGGPLRQSGISDTDMKFEFDLGRMLVVEDGHATLNGEDLRHPVQESPDTDFAKSADAPEENVFTTGTLYLPYPVE